MKNKIILIICLSVLAYSNGQNNKKGNLSITKAVYENPTDTYPKYVMGGNVQEHATLTVYDQSLNAYSITLKQDKETGFVFEAKTPRIADMDGDGYNDVCVVESSVTKGSSLSIYSIRDGEIVKIAQNAFLGKSPQWLAIAGITDFDGDGQNEIAYVEKPHGYNHLTFWKLKKGELVKIGDMDELTGHIEGTDFYQFAIRNCKGKLPQVVLNDSKFETIYAVGFKNRKLTKEALGKYVNEKSAYKLSQNCN